MKTLKYILFLSSLCFFLTGCGNKEIREFEGEIIAMNSSRFDDGMIIQNESGERIHIKGYYSNMPGSYEYSISIVGDVVYVEYEWDDFDTSYYARKFFRKVD